MCVFLLTSCHGSPDVRCQTDAAWFQQIVSHGRLWNTRRATHTQTSKTENVFLMLHSWIINTVNALTAILCVHRNLSDWCVGRRISRYYSALDTAYCSVLAGVHWNSRADNYLPRGSMANFATALPFHYHLWQKKESLSVLTLSFFRLVNKQLSTTSCQNSNENKVVYPLCIQNVTIIQFECFCCGATPRRDVCFFPPPNALLNLRATRREAFPHLTSSDWVA